VCERDASAAALRARHAPETVEQRAPEAVEQRTELLHLVGRGLHVHAAHALLLDGRRVRCTEAAAALARNAVQPGRQALLRELAQLPQRAPLELQYTLRKCREPEACRHARFMRHHT
jgi:hypothetical protein